MPVRKRWWLIGAPVALVLAFPIGWGAYAGVAWLRFGHATHATDDSLAVLYMPAYDIAEVHETHVRAPAPKAFAALMDLDLLRSPVIRSIFRGREIVLRAPPDTRPRTPLLSDLLSLGWGVLAEVPGRELVYGAVTQPWTPDVTFRSLPPASFAAFDSAGYVKILVTFVVDSIGPSESVFRTETRVLATDAESREKFRRYWSVFSPGILLIRREALRVVRQDAEGPQ